MVRPSKKRITSGVPAAGGAPWNTAAPALKFVLMLKVPAAPPPESPTEVVCKAGAEEAPPVSATNFPAKGDAGVPPSKYPSSRSTPSPSADDPAAKATPTLLSSGLVTGPSQTTCTVGKA